MTLKARVKAGRLLVDEPTELPEGTEIELLPLDPGDGLDETDRAALHRALRDSTEDVTAGRLVDADVVLRQLRSRRDIVTSDSLPRLRGMSTVRKRGGSSRSFSS
jgi:hypothetical protein